MKQILIRLIILLVIAIVISVYVLYLLQNLPSIIQTEKTEETPDSPLGDSLITSVINNVAIKQDEHQNNIWQAIDRSESYNGELQFYSQDNIVIKDKSITIMTKKENRGTKSYTSGMVTSKNAYLYGYFSFHIKVSDGQGIFPAIWLLPKVDKKLPEIDIFEMIGSEPLKFYGVIHYGSAEKRQREYFQHKVAKKESYEVGIKWTKDEISWYIDNRCVFQTGKGVPSEPMYLIINQAVGGNWAHSPDDTTAFPATFVVSSYTVKPELIIQK